MTSGKACDDQVKSKANSFRGSSGIPSPGLYTDSYEQRESLVEKDLECDKLSLDNIDGGQEQTCTIKREGGLSFLGVLVAVVAQFWMIIAFLRLDLETSSWLLRHVQVLQYHAFGRWNQQARGQAEEALCFIVFIISSAVFVAAHLVGYFKVVRRDELLLVHLICALLGAAFWLPLGATVLELILVFLPLMLNAGLLLMYSRQELRTRRGF